MVVSLQGCEVPCMCGMSAVQSLTFKCAFAAVHMFVGPGSSGTTFVWHGSIAFDSGHSAGPRHGLASSLPCIFGPYGQQQAATWLCVLLIVHVLHAYKDQVQSCCDFLCVGVNVGAQAGCRC